MSVINKNGVKNKTKDDKVFSNYLINNITGAEIMESQSKRKRSVEDMIQRKRSYVEILKTDKNTAGNQEQTRNEGAVDIVTNKGSLGLVNESHVTNNRVQIRGLKIEKPIIKEQL